MRAKKKQKGGKNAIHHPKLPAHTRDLLKDLDLRSKSTRNPDSAGAGENGGTGKNGNASTSPPKPLHTRDNNLVRAISDPIPEYEPDLGPFKRDGPAEDIQARGFFHDLEEDFDNAFNSSPVANAGEQEETLNLG